MDLDICWIMVDADTTSDAEAKDQCAGLHRRRKPRTITQQAGHFMESTVEIVHQAP